MDNLNWQAALRPSVRWMVLLDLESTCSNTKKPAPSEAVIGRGEGEVIEIGAVVIDLQQQVRPRGFRTLVRPVGNPILTTYCTGLTKITQEAVEAAPTFPQACAALSEFLAPLNNQENGWAWASWGQSDLNVLDATAARYGIAHPLPADRHHNLKGAFAVIRGGEEGIGRVMERLAIRPHGKPHRALSDACNLARFYPVMRRYATAQAAAAEHFGIDRAQKWMRENNPELGGRRPAIMMHNDDELAQVLGVIEPTTPTNRPEADLAPAEQLEFWAKVGRAALDNSDLPASFIAESLTSMAEPREDSTVFEPRSHNQSSGGKSP